MSKMKQTPIAIFLAIAAFTACSKPSPLNEMTADGARQSAEMFYAQLAEGQTEEYVKNMQSACEMDSSMFTQINDLMLQFLEQEKKLRGGIVGATASADSISDSTSVVMLDLQYGNGTHERVALPMVFTRGRWYIK